jgi:hypothetical protein
VETADGIMLNASFRRAGAESESPKSTILRICPRRSQPPSGFQSKVAHVSPAAWVTVCGVAKWALGLQQNHTSKATEGGNKKKKKDSQEPEAHSNCVMERLSLTLISVCPLWLGVEFINYRT